VWDAEYPWDVRAEKTCLSLTEAGHDVHIVARNRTRLPISECLPEATVHRMPPWRWAGPLDAGLSFPAFFSPRWRSLISSVVREVNADVIFVRDLPLCPTAISVGKREHVPVVLDLAEHYPAMMRAIWETGQHRPLDWLVRNPRTVERVERYCIANVDHIITVADEMSDRLVRLGVAPSRITRVSNTPILNEFASESRSATSSVTSKPPQPIRLVYLGLLEVVRGINEILDAVASLRGHHPRVSLLLIGSGRDERLFRDRAASLGLGEGDVEFAGYVPYASAMRRVASADIGVLPLHRNEHMDTTEPNKLFDYMSVGLPVITSNTIPSARIIRAEHAGLVFEAGDAASLAEAIVSLSDAGKRTEMGANGRVAVKRFYNWKHDSQQLLKAVESVQLNSMSLAAENGAA
jgi:glycosyltransferase involved in cell wall biosynthesis